MPPVELSDASFALTPQDHAVTQVHRTLREHQRGYRVGQATTVATAAVTAAGGALGLVPSAVLLPVVVGSITLAAALPWAHRHAVNPLLESLTNNGPDVGQVRQALHAQLRELRVASVFVAGCSVVFSAMALAVDPTWWVMTGICAAGLWLGEKKDRPRIEAQLEELSATKVAHPALQDGRGGG